MFDRSPLGLNLWLGLKMRCMLGHHIFASLGKGVKIYRNVDFTYGYNLTIEDNCVIHRGVYLDDRKPITLHEGTEVKDDERVTSDNSPNR
jgi:acetyltransferase-like isoleucine patch superfamily enzyme